MAEFKTVSGQLEGMWNGAMGEAEAAGRKAGEAAGVERALQAVEFLVSEWSSHSAIRPGDLVPELRRRLSAVEPLVVDDGLERLTFAEWEERARLAGWVQALDREPELPPDEVIEVDEQGRVHGLVTGPLREGPDMRPGFRVGDIAEPLVGREGDEERRVLVDRRGGEAPLPEIARDFEGERARQLAAEDAAQVFPPPVEATFTEDEALAAQFGGSAASSPETVLEAEASAEAREQSAL